MSSTAFNSYSKIFLRKNEDEIRMLISKNLGCIKLNESSQKVEDRLRELVELKILEEFRKGTFAI